MMTVPGTRFTLPALPLPRKNYSRFAAILKPLTAALRPSPAISKKKASPGASKRSCETPTNGLPEKGNRTMEPTIARGFLINILSNDQRKALHAWEKTLPTGRYLTGFEICRRFHLTPKPITDAETSAMNELWARWEPVLWKKRMIAEKTGQPLSTTQELWAWEEFVLANYRAPVTATRDDGIFTRD